MYLVRGHEGDSNTRKVLETWNENSRADPCKIDMGQPVIPSKALVNTGDGPGFRDGAVLAARRSMYKRGHAQLVGKDKRYH